jgi:hypothetical protein
LPTYSSRSFFRRAGQFFGALAVAFGVRAVDFRAGFGNGLGLQRSTFRAQPHVRIRGTMVVAMVMVVPFMSLFFGFNQELLFNAG